MEVGLPDEIQRYKLLCTYTSSIREHKVASDVDLQELAALTQNFSRVELKELVRVAEDKAMNKVIKVSSEGELDLSAMGKLMVSRADFLHALENEVKPAFGRVTVVDHLLARGIINWGRPVAEIIAASSTEIRRRRASESIDPVTILLEGPPNSGKTALAAQIAKNSDFPFVKVFTPDDMIGYSVTAKCISMRNLFDDASRSQLSCILVDNIERLIDYEPIGPNYSYETFQALRVFLKYRLPRGIKLLVICTTSNRQLFWDLELLPAFDTILHVPNLSKPDHLLAVLEDQDVFTKSELLSLHAKLQGKKVSIGIKKLLKVIDLARKVDPSNRMTEFLSELKEQGGLE
ncbi:vesicle-fusing ATPase 1-like [Microplitis mediator]|uniref:vesicle-fusing ATPase 1-like n=1 Tax=Microplitis mediator TaxID=375433 RepID=UPI0025529812|nr:vesicle-fusing ATPase 1-like [Microplitis mediator]